MATLIHRAAQGAIRAADALHWSDGVLDDEAWSSIHRFGSANASMEASDVGSPEIEGLP